MDYEQVNIYFYTVSLRQWSFDQMCVCVHIKVYPSRDDAWIVKDSSHFPLV